MDFEFYKYHGAGNDFVIIDNRNKQFPQNDIDLIQKVCFRRFGIGSDGLILISDDGESDFYMDFYNPDASRSFCGNGSRCAVMFAYHLGMIGEQCSFRSIHGINEAWVINDRTVRLKMFDVDGVEVGEDYYYLNTGSPHYNIYTDKVEEVKLIPLAHEIRYGDRFRQEGTNVNLIQVLDRGSIKVRTYERGVEDETWACGTGVTACAITQVLKNNWQGKNKIEVEANGGNLTVELDRDAEAHFKDIYLTGPAEFVFKGEWNG